MFCISIKEKSFERCAQILKECEMAEIRADLCGFSAQQVGELCKVNKNVIVTCRISQDGSVKHTEEVLLGAIAAGARYIDIEMEAGEDIIAEIKKSAIAAGAKLIVSYHNYICTPPINELIKIYDGCIDLGGEIVKIVTTALSVEDAQKTLSLYSYVKCPNALVAFSMGEIGSFSREKSLTLGAPYTYVSYQKGEETASGQSTIFCHFK